MAAPPAEPITSGSLAAGKGEELDLEELIAGFLADESRTELELPHMTTGQRKQTKKLVEQQAGLRCESFGFGQERQLHLFKASHEASGAAAAASSPTATSPPSAASPSPKGGVAAAGGATPQRTGAEQHWETATTEACSTAASTPGSPGSSPRTSALRHLNIGKPPGLATPLGVAAVRNTFIHFESSKEDERQVQSLPHGMFRQQLWAEALSESVAEQALLSPSLSPAIEKEEPQPKVAVQQLELLEPEESLESKAELLPGTEVQINGLSKCPAFNGRRAIVQSFDQETGRYDVVLWSASGEQRAKVKRENLGHVSPLSPVAAPFSPQGSYDYLTSTAAPAGAPAGFPWGVQSPTGQFLQAR